VQASDRSEFEKGLAEIFAAIDKPLGDAQREAFWRGLKQMSLIEFSRCRDKIIDDQRDGELPRKFGVSDIWLTKSKLQAAAPSMPAHDGFRGDNWTIASNLHFLAYILRAAQGRRKVIGTDIFVRHKNLWAEQMRLSADPKGEVPVAEQKEVWAECMKRAEEEIAGAA